MGTKPQKSYREDPGDSWSQFRVSVPKTHTFMLFLSIVASWLIKVYDKKPASFQWVEQNLKRSLSSYISPESVSDSFEFTISTLILWLCIYLSYRMILQSLLKYRGWIFESRGSVSLFTRVWGAVLTALSKGLTGFYAFQNHCPPLPVPKLEETIQKYLSSMRPILVDADFDKLKKNSQIFLKTVGPSIQSELMKKWWMSSNYVTDWWETYVYLRTRESIMINSNYYGLAPKEVPTTNQTARIAGQTWSLLKWRKDALIDNKVLPLKLQKLVPLCPNQYKRFFSTSRIPGEQKDEILTFEGSTHITVFANNKVFKMEAIKTDGTPLTQQQLEANFVAIKADNTGASNDNKNCKISHLAAGTALNRTKWAKIREKLKENNSISLETVESALFHIWLDDDRAQNSKESLARRSLHGKGDNIWFDKSYTVIAFSDGQFGLNCEHAWADGAVTCHASEEANVIEHLFVNYDSDTGRIVRNENQLEIRPEIECLQWTDLDDVLDLIKPEMKGIEQSISNLDHAILDFKKFGKNDIKKWKVSPDGICQMAFQLANFKTRAKFVLTYEAGLARIFKDGRTETIRSCSEKSVAWVNEMNSSSFDKEKSKRALLDAIRHHGTLTKQAMIGDGVDRHLFALYIAAAGMQIESEFLADMKKAEWKNSSVRGWELSTSCAPNGLGEYYDSRKYPHLVSMGAGFGWTNGYGIGYQMNDESISVHVTCSKAQGNSAETFKENLQEALVEIGQLFQ